MGTIRLQPERDRPVRHRHPWIYSGSVAEVADSPAPGEIVEVQDSRGEWLARGYYNPRSQIVVRLLTWDRHQAIDTAFWRARLNAAAEMRAALALEPETTAYRLVFAESDLLPGLIVDRYGDWLSVQFLTLGVEVQRDQLLALLQELWNPRGVVERSDALARKQEGLPLRSGLLAGEPLAGELEVFENGLRFRVDLTEGQKTGFYVDQRQNRKAAAEYAAGKRVLNAFSFTGAFAVYALAAGAEHVTNIDTSYEALEAGETMLRINGFDPDRQAESIQGDVFQVLRDFRDRKLTFDHIILDPPKFARNRGELEGATRGYKDINLLALRLLAPGGILTTFSCSGLVSPDLFQKIVFGASVDAQRNVQILTHLSQGADHPILLSFPEGEYLKGLLCRVT